MLYHFDNTILILCPAKKLTPSFTVSIHSVTYLNVMQGEPRRTTYCCIPPESVDTNPACLMTI